MVGTQEEYQIQDSRLKTRFINSMAMKEEIQFGGKIDLIGWNGKYTITQKQNNL